MIPEDINWKKDWKSVEFDDAIRITGFWRGRSSTTIDALSIDNRREYAIFMVDFYDMLAAGVIDKDMQISGKFIVTKRGRNFGIRLKGTPKAERRLIYNLWEYPECPVPFYV